MIIPYYSLGPVPKVADKWYCSYFEELGLEQYFRYLHPNGWKLHAHYFDSKKDAELAFQKFNQSRIPVSHYEVQNRREENRLLEDMFERDYWD